MRQKKIYDDHMSEPIDNLDALLDAVMVELRRGDHPAVAEYKKKVFGARWAGVPEDKRKKIMRKRAKERWAGKQPYKVCTCGVECRTRAEYWLHRRKSQCRNKKD